jgi:uncharacterized protein with PQ loop repeat
MVHATGASPDRDAANGPLEKLLPVLSVLTMVMTLPQIWSLWVEHNVAGVSLMTWATYLVSACVWFVHALKKHDPKMYIACIGWILLDGAVVAGVLVYG